MCLYRWLWLYNTVIDYRELNWYIDTFTANTEVLGMAVREIWCCHFGSEEGLSLDAHTQISVALSDNNVEAMEVLPHATWIWLKLCANDNAIHYELSDLLRYGNTMSHVVINWWHLHQHTSCIPRSGKETIGLQDSWMTSRRSTSAWTTCWK